MKVYEIRRWYPGYISDDYNYLGIVFNYNGSFTKAIDKQIPQARKCYTAYLQKLTNYLPIDITCELFDHLILPILLYDSEVCGLLTWTKLRYSLDIF